MTTEESDESLVLRIRKNDHRAFAFLVRRHTDKFYALAWRMTGRSDEAEDIVQQAFLKLWEDPGIFRPEAGARFTTWFYRVVTNLALDVIRRRKPQAGEDMMAILPDQGALPEKQVVDREFQAHLERAIQSLPERQKTALNLCFYEGLSNKEAAEVMGVGIKALESHLMRAKASVRESLIRQGSMDREEYDGRKNARHG